MAKYRVGDILRMDFGIIDQHTKQPQIYYALITETDGQVYIYHYLDEWELEWDSVNFIDTHKGITLHA